MNFTAFVFMPDDDHDPPFRESKIVKSEIVMKRHQSSSLACTLHKMQEVYQKHSLVL